MIIQKGSAIICVLMVTAGLFALMGLIIRYTTYNIDIAHQRMLHEQHYFALKGLLNYGIALAEKRSISGVVTIPIDSWLTDYSGKIVLSPQKDSITVQTFLDIAQNKSIDAQYTVNKIKIF